MTYLDLASLKPLVACLAPEPVRLLLAALAEGLEEEAANRARSIARAVARGIAAGQAAKASSDATSAMMRARRAP